VPIEYVRVKAALSCFAFVYPRAHVRTVTSNRTHENTFSCMATTSTGDSRSVVHYKSSALDEIGMLKRPASEVMNCPGVLAAHETAEKVREAFKLKEKEKREADMQMNMEANAKIPVAGGDIDKGARYDRRTKLNRQSAAASRIRKEAYIKALEQQLLIHDDKYKELERSFLEEHPFGRSTLRRRAPGPRRHPTDFHQPNPSSPIE